jgi:hypothetical protein
VGKAAIGYIDAPQTANPSTKNVKIRHQSVLAGGLADPLIGLLLIGSTQMPNASSPHEHI